MIQAINPIDGGRIASYEEMSPAAVKRAVEVANERFLSWRTTGFAHRAERMRKAGAILRANAKDYGRLMAQEMGKPIKDGIGEANKSALGCDYYADHAEKFLTPEIVPTDAKKSFIAYQPLGVVLAVMPWNFPFWQVFRCGRPGADGRQRDGAEARLERAGLRAGDRKGLPARRASRKVCSAP